MQKIITDFKAYEYLPVIMEKYIQRKIMARMAGDCMHSLSEFVTQTPSKSLK